MIVDISIIGHLSTTPNYRVNCLYNELLHGSCDPYTMDSDINKLVSFTLTHLNVLASASKHHTIIIINV